MMKLTVQARRFTLNWELLAMKVLARINLGGFWTLPHDGRADA
jgi:hypothetical protein